MTNLIEFRRRRQNKKRTEELAEQLDKQNTALSHLQTLFTTHEHEKNAAKTHVHEKYVAKTELPKPYVHPKTGICPQKPQPHAHIAKDIADLKIPEPYDLEQLKKDHPKLRAPYLHEPKKHSHDAKDITDKIQPEQIERKGLDADMVDGKHAKDLVKRVYVGGGGAVNHADLLNVLPDQHHNQLHASSHEKGGIDVLGVVVAFKFGAEGATTTSTVYVTIANSDIAFNPALFKFATTLYVKFIYHIKNDTAGKTTYIRVFRQNAATAVAGSEAAKSDPGWLIVETTWIDWSGENMTESYQIQMKVSGGVGEFNSALMILSPVQL